MAKLGWEKALGRYAQVANVEEFYERFAKFLDEPIGVQMQMLAALKP